MGVIKNTIIVEDVLRQLFSYIPEINGFKPVFGSGDKYELNAFLKLKKNQNNYPLIWLIYPYKENNTKTNVKLDNLNFILAVENTNGLLNIDLIDKVYKPILYKVLDYITELFKRTSIINWNGEYNVIKFPNYNGDNNDEGENDSIAKWDALKLTVSFSIMNGCIKKINL